MLLLFLSGPVWGWEQVVEVRSGLVCWASFTQFPTGVSRLPASAAVVPQSGRRAAGASTLPWEAGSCHHAPAESVWETPGLPWLVPHGDHLVVGGCG